MERKTASEFDQDLLILFDAYDHGVDEANGFDTEDRSATETHEEEPKGLVTVAPRTRGSC